ncbi:hypothetical protein AVEN_57332-1 [Araneus ventricosus]|uniref:Uncharacterized protein n=1 Tax=Araneus ventricosus TaxID=182803 RepID=A0A4Y2IPC0_ARAVE|nr:hypothetical protein AVEN_57332-1 [Araneus ventricosus]
MAAKGIETRITTGDSDTYIVIIPHPVVAITGQNVDLVVLLIALAPPESDIYFTKPGMGRVEANFFLQESPKKNLLFPKPSSFFMHSVAAT